MELRDVAVKVEETLAIFENFEKFNEELKVKLGRLFSTEVTLNDHQLPETECYFKSITIKGNNELSVQKTKIYLTAIFHTRSSFCEIFEYDKLYDKIICDNLEIVEQATGALLMKDNGSLLIFGASRENLNFAESLLKQIIEDNKRNIYIDLFNSDTDDCLCLNSTINLVDDSIISQNSVIFVKKAANKGFINNYNDDDDDKMDMTQTDEDCDSNNLDMDVDNDLPCENDSNNKVSKSKSKENIQKTNFQPIPQLPFKKGKRKRKKRNRLNDIPEVISSNGLSPLNNCAGPSSKISSPSSNKHLSDLFVTELDQSCFEVEPASMQSNNKIVSNQNAKKSFCNRKINSANNLVKENSFVKNSNCLPPSEKMFSDVTVNGFVAEQKVVQICPNSSINIVDVNNNKNSKNNSTKSFQIVQNQGLDVQPLKNLFTNNPHQNQPLFQSEIKSIQSENSFVNKNANIINSDVGDQDMLNEDSPRLKVPNNPSDIQLNEDDECEDDIIYCGTTRGVKKDTSIIGDKVCRDGMLRPIVIDGSNVAMSHGLSKCFSCTGIQLVVNYFQQRGHKEITTFVPQWRRATSTPGNVIRNKEILEKLYQEGLLAFTQSRKVGNRCISSYDDRYILKHATEEGAIVISNDQYQDLYREKIFKDTIEKRLLQVTFVGDKVMFPDDPLGRDGPTLDEFLKFPNSTDDNGYQKKLNFCTLPSISPVHHVPLRNQHSTTNSNDFAPNNKLSVKQAEFVGTQSKMFFNQKINQEQPQHNFSNNMMNNPNNQPQSNSLKGSQSHINQSRPSYSSVNQSNSNQPRTNTFNFNQQHQPHINHQHFNRPNINRPQFSRPSTSTNNILPTTNNNNPSSLSSSSSSSNNKQSDCQQNNTNSFRPEAVTKALRNNLLQLYPGREKEISRLLKFNPRASDLNFFKQVLNNFKRL